MKTQQPEWAYLANLGDADPFISAALVYLDKTGVYPPEMVVFNEDARGENGGLLVSRVVLDRCTMREARPETLSSNPYHADRPEWFADKLGEAAECSGCTVGEVAEMLVSSEPIRRAEGYLILVGYFGIFEFDQYPVEMSRVEIRRRYRAAFRKTRAVAIAGVPAR